MSYCSSSSSSSSSSRTPPNLKFKPGSTLRYSYYYKGMEYGREKITRVATIPILLQILDKRLQYLMGVQNRLHLPEDSSRNRLVLESRENMFLYRACERALSGESHIPESVQKEIEECTLELIDLEQTINSYPRKTTMKSLEMKKDRLKERILYLKECSQFDWIGSNYVRDCLSQTNLNNKRDHFDDDFAEHMKTTREILPGTVNLRRHEIMTKDGKKETILRLGVISDMRNGYFSLDQMMKMKSNGSRSKEFRKLTRKLQAKVSKNKPNRELMTLCYAKNQLEDDNSLDASISSRRRFMERQMMVLVMEHLKTYLEVYPDFENNDTLPIMNLSLLNRKTKKTDPTGWRGNEEVFMRDMAKIFSLFDNVTIFFDGEGPLFNSESNTLHLPEEFGIKMKSLILKTFFVNISVQNHTKNDKIQSVINKRFFDSIDRRRNLGRLRPEFQKVKNALFKGGESNFTIAEKLAGLALRSGFFLSVNCLSGKDRTGFLCGRIGINTILDDIPHLSSKKRHILENLWTPQMMNGPALAVCHECNFRALKPLNVKGLKVVAPSLPGVGAMRRTGQFGELVQTLAIPTSKKNEKSKYPEIPFRRNTIFQDYHPGFPGNRFTETRPFEKEDVDEESSDESECYQIPTISSEPLSSDDSFIETKENVNTPDVNDSDQEVRLKVCELVQKFNDLSKI